MAITDGDYKTSDLQTTVVLAGYKLRCVPPPHPDSQFKQWPALGEFSRVLLRI